MNKFPASGTLISHLRKVLGRGGDIEEELERFAQSADNNPRFRRQLLGLRFYLREVLDKCGYTWHRKAGSSTNYSQLVLGIEQWRHQIGEPILLVTFNYDKMLELGLDDAVGWVTPSLDAYINQDDYKLIKLHGSVDWTRSTNISTQFRDPIDLINRAQEIEESSEISLPGGGLPMATVPALAIPTVGKGSFQCPESHIGTLKKLLPQVDRLLVVGWRARENSFLQICDEFLPQRVRGLVANGSVAAGAEVYENFPRAGIRSTDHTFSTLVRADDSLDELGP